MPRYAPAPNPEIETILLHLAKSVSVSAAVFILAFFVWRLIR